MNLRSSVFTSMGGTYMWGEIYSEGSHNELRMDRIRMRVLGKGPISTVMLPLWLRGCLDV